ncbi:hypothetical protein [Sphingomonas morindae]|uniref:Uncharacterized protein n=1 Tax=Sphingomonas morindae TaxID=1541170 RepID=A0ABY4XD75_9SPHN|nr:hypothetical protein [Sphingomonas morindae]USI74872.1 hypothetical protein LHA26_17005 [Sphingomonas morindae]
MPIIVVRHSKEAIRSGMAAEKTGDANARGSFSWSWAGRGSSIKLQLINTLRLLIGGYRAG